LEVASGCCFAQENKKDDGTVGGQKTEVLQKGEKKQRARRGSIAGIQPAIHIYPRVFHFRAEAGRLAGESHPPGRVRLGAGGMELVDGCAERAFLASLVSGEEEESVQHDVGTGWEG
jgi:hypothetical protein